MRVDLISKPTTPSGIGNGVLLLAICVAGMGALGCQGRSARREVASAAPESLTRQATPLARLDHILLGIADLEAGIDQLEKMTGVRAVFGGEHPHMGTHNALVALDPELYLEVIAPRPDSDEAAGMRAYTNLTPFLFAVRTSNVELLRKRLGSAGFATSEPQAGSRLRPDGSVLHWVTFAITEPALYGAPFFIQWGDLSRHPAKTSPHGGGLAALVVATPDAKEVNRLVELLSLKHVKIQTADAPSMQVQLRTPNGAVVISSD